MSSPNEIRNHIAAVEQTRKITRAMEMISSNRMRKRMDSLAQNHFCFDSVQRMMKGILDVDNGITHPYLKERPVNHTTFLVISGDKGMCGAYNSTVLGFARERIEAASHYAMITIGHMAESYFMSLGMVPDISLRGIAEQPTLHRARELTRQIMKIYDEGLTDEIRVIFTDFYSKNKNLPVERRLLPIRLADYRDIPNTEKVSEMIFMPSPQKVFDVLIPQYLIGILFGVMMQAYASENSARMNAMHSATTNAQEMLESLTTKYNLARQSAITNEIAEITGAVEILKGEDPFV